MREVPVFDGPIVQLNFGWCRPPGAGVLLPDPAHELLDRLLADRHLPGHHLHRHAGGVKPQGRVPVSAGGLAERSRAVDDAVTAGTQDGATPGSEHAGNAAPGPVPLLMLIAEVNGCGSA